MSGTGATNNFDTCGNPMLALRELFTGDVSCVRAVFYDAIHWAFA